VFNKERGKSCGHEGAKVNVGARINSSLCDNKLCKNHLGYHIGFNYLGINSH
jgi:hypothetical protein